jgi:RHS repeat-associated protein
MTGDETGREFVYDAWNRLVTVKNSSGTTLETFSYDGLSRRVTQTASGTTTDLYYSKDWQVLEEEVGGAATARYVWSPVYVNAMVLRDFATGSPGTLNQRLWVQQDANWNVTALVNGSGAVVERSVYSPYGVVSFYSASWSSLGSSAYSWTIGYQGMRFDPISGLSAADERWDTPTLQRWTGLDPIRYSAGDVDLYRCVGNNPIGVVDPSGLLPPSDPLVGRFSDDHKVWSGDKQREINENATGTVAGLIAMVYGGVAGKLAAGAGALSATMDGHDKGQMVKLATALAAARVGVGVYRYFRGGPPAAQPAPTAPSPAPPAKPTPPSPQDYPSGPWASKREYLEICKKELEIALREAHKHRLNPKHIEDMATQLAKILRELRDLP